MESKFFSNEVVNKGRQNEFDWAKAFTIIVMITVHVYEFLGVFDPEKVPLKGVFRNVLEFLAGPLGAPLFMFSMGIGILYSRNSTPAKMGVRGVKLLRNGYLLSFFKGTLPILVGMAIGMSSPITIADSLFLISILQFAGMAFFTIALMKKFKFSLPAMLTTSILLCIIGTNLNTTTMQGWKQYILGLFFVTNLRTSFPLFLWLFYPVAGMIFAYFLQRAIDKKKFYIWLFCISAAGLIITCIIYSLCGINLKSMYELYERHFYTQTVLHYIFTTFVIGMAMPVYYLISEVVKAKPVTAAVAYLGRNLDVIYIAQWMVVAYTTVIFTVAGWPKLTLPFVLPVGIICMLIAIGFSEIYLRLKKKSAEKKDTSKKKNQ